MGRNVGKWDRTLRIVFGLVLIAYAVPTLYAPVAAYLPGWPAIAGWGWLGWLGVIPLATGLAANCPAYSVLGVSTCDKARAA